MWRLCLRDDLIINVCPPRRSQTLSWRRLRSLRYTAMQLYPKGRNWGPHVNWDDLGKLYAGLIIAWTIILAGGIAWLIVNRRVPSVKIRNVALSVAAVAFLHVYLVKIFLAYTTNGHFTCSAEFWIMSIYLPFGIALFQANTVQLENISEEQQLLLRRESSLSQYDIRKASRQTRNVWDWWRSATSAQRTYVYIGIGMLIQVCLCLDHGPRHESLTHRQLIITGILYATSPELQGDWSSYGHITHAAGQLKCRGSLEWYNTLLANTMLFANVFEGSLPLSGSCSGLGYTDHTSCIKSETSRMSIIGVCRST